MKVNLFSIFDKKSLVFSPPFPAPTYGAAERAIEEQFRNPETQLAKWPQDFSLFTVGIFDDEIGSTESFANGLPILIVEVSSFVKE